MNALILLLLFFAVNCQAVESSLDAKIEDFVKKGMTSSQIINALTYEDVPTKWISSIVDESTEEMTLFTFYRGKQKRLTVGWHADWVGERGDMFIFTVYDGDDRVISIPGLSDSFIIPQAKKDSDYEIMTQIKNDGTITLLVEEGDEILEMIILDRRKSRLIDDLEYTKTRLAMVTIANPLLDIINEELEKKE